VDIEGGKGDRYRKFLSLALEIARSLIELLRLLT
jgi:hypothetical protein